MTLDQSTVDALIGRVVRLMETKCIRRLADVGWAGLFAEYADALRRSERVQDLESTVNAVLMRGGLSHVAFFHETARAVPARYAICATFGSVETTTGPRWTFQDVLEGGPADDAGVRPGDILVAVDGKDVHPPEAVRFSLGTDVELTILGGNGVTRTTRVLLPKADLKGRGKGRPPMADPTSVSFRALGDGVGYVRIASFPGVTGQGFARQLTHALDALHECTRMVFDLRGNVGGFLGSLRLMSCLTPNRVPVGYSLTRWGEDRDLQRDQLACIDRLPETTVQRLTMVVRFMVLYRDRSVRLMTEGLGDQPFHGRVVILVNEHTASAAEMVAAFAAERQLATLIGIGTAGQVLGGANFSVGEGFRLRLPAAGWYTWNGAIVEGRGVTPDIEVPLSIGALRAGRDTQLESALEAVRRM